MLPIPLILIVLIFTNDFVIEGHLKKIKRHEAVLIYNLGYVGVASV